MAGLYGYKYLTSTVEVNDGTSSDILFGTPLGDTIIRLIKAIIMVTVAGDAGNNIVQLKDSVTGTVYFQADADVVGVYNIDFADIGYPIAVNEALLLVVSGGSTEATARCTALAHIT